MQIKPTQVPPHTFQMDKADKKENSKYQRGFTGKKGTLIH